MARVLGLKTPAHESETCLTCHGVTAEAGQRGPKYDRDDGVSCEGCHGRAGAWLEPHTRKGWTYAESLKLGMYDNRDLAKRADGCLRCHSGIDHGLLSAGHPDLVFELDTFSAVMPKHWKEKQPWAGAKSWAVGQALALQRSMEVLAKRTGERKRLDEADRNCFSCHHNIYDVNWPLNPQVPGKALWNASHYAIFRHFLQQAFPEQDKELAGSIETIDAAFRSDQPDLPGVTQAANQVAGQMKDLVAKIDSFGFQPALVEALVQQISGDQEAYQKGGFRVAEQGLMAVDALTLSAAGQKVGRPAVLQQVRKLYDLLDVKDPARYNPKVFAAGMEQLHKMVAQP